MQLFIGGACAGKRDTVRARFPGAAWYALAPGGSLAGWPDRRIPGRPLVVTGWVEWLVAALAEEADDDRLRARLREALDAMRRVESGADGEFVLILPEMGRGIVPLAAEDRRLRDLAGWLAQDAAARADEVWYVRHGLARCLRCADRAADSR